MKKYDIIIIGGGIAGIYTMYNLRKRYPNLKILLLEKDDRLGGRVYTYKKKFNGHNYIMDLGAGRIGFHHNEMNFLIKELGLEDERIAITNCKNYKEIHKNFKGNYIVADKSQTKIEYYNLLYKVLNKLNKLNKLNIQNIQNITEKILKKTYLYEILSKLFSKKEFSIIKNTFEYNNKLYYLNSFDAIKIFKSDYNQYSRFFIMKNGFSTIIEKMVEKITQKKNYKIKNNCFVNNISFNQESNNYIVTYIINENKVYASSKQVICALPRYALTNLKILKPFTKELNSINEISKVRIFEIYDNNNNNVWFKNIPKTTTNDNLQFIIPIDPKSGLIMSSYNENLSTKNNYWYNLYKNNENKMRETLNKKLCLIFNMDIPKSIYMKIQYWKMGIACWKKNIDSHYISQKLLNPFPNFYICGENYSEYQAWCEGALLTSNKVIENIDNYFIQKKINKTKKNIIF